MKLKNLLEGWAIKKEEEKNTSKFQSSQTTTFPSSPPAVSATINISVECGAHMESVMKLYETGFQSLNRPGIEFFEFYDAVMEAGVNDPNAYKMALKILSKSERGMTKDSLISQSQYYIDELTKVHAKYNAEGVKKKETLTSEKYAEGQRLNNDISLLRDQIQSLKNQQAAKEMQLAQIDNKYSPQINDLDCKIMANNEAKNVILASINTVVNGIKVNL